MDQICTNSPIVDFGPWSLISGKKYYVDTQFGNWKGTIHGTFDMNKIKLWVKMTIFGRLY